MPFPFTLPTTSHLALQKHLLSPTHPSLPANATAARNTVRTALKSHKRLPLAQQRSNLSTVLGLLNEYIPFVLALDVGLSDRPLAGESIDVTLLQEIEVKWRSTLSPASLPGRGPARIPGRGLDYELHNVLHVLAVIHSLLARESMLQIYTPSSSTSQSYSLSASEPRTLAVQAANKHFLSAHALHSHLLHLATSSSEGTSFPKDAVDVYTSTQSSLAELSLAEATLLFVLKDDPYPALLQQSRDKSDREWMVKAPEVPRVRSHLFARLCIGAAEHASKAASVARSASGDGGKGLVKEFVTYCEDLRVTARARGCRFIAIDAESGGKTGEGIAWLRAGLGELGLEAGGDGSGNKMSLSRFKSSWSESKETRKLEKGETEEWGADAGKGEEARILEWLEKKWAKQNDTINVQLVPDHKALAGQLPSGREAFGSGVGKWTPSQLDEDTLARLRSPIDEPMPEDEPSSGEDDDPRHANSDSRHAPGAFPSSQGAHDSGGGYY